MHEKKKCLCMHKRYKCSSFDTTHSHFTQDSSYTTHKIHTTLKNLGFEEHIKHLQQLRFVNKWDQSKKGNYDM